MKRNRKGSKSAPVSSRGLESARPSGSKWLWSASLIAPRTDPYKRHYRIRLPLWRMRAKLPLAHGFIPRTLSSRAVSGLVWDGTMFSLARALFSPGSAEDRSWFRSQSTRRIFSEAPRGSPVAIQQIYWKTRYFPPPGRLPDLTFGVDCQQPSFNGLPFARSWRRVQGALAKSTFFHECEKDWH